MICIQEILLHTVMGSPTIGHYWLNYFGSVNDILNQIGQCRAPHIRLGGFDTSKIGLKCELSQAWDVLQLREARQKQPSIKICSARYSKISHVISKDGNVFTNKCISSCQTYKRLSIPVKTFDKTPVFTLQKCEKDGSYGVALIDHFNKEQVISCGKNADKSFEERIIAVLLPPSI